MSRAQLIPVGAGVVTAVLHLSVTLGPLAGILLAYFAMVPVAATGFGLGFMPASIAAAVAAVIIALAAPGVGALSLFLLTSAAPVLALVHFALTSRTNEDGTVHWYPMDRLLGMLTAFGLAIFAVALVIFGGSPAGLQNATREFLEPFALAVGGGGRGLDQLIHLFPGIVGASWMLMIGSNCAIAYLAIRRWGAPIRRDTRFREIDVPLWPLGTLTLGAALSLLGGDAAYIGTNVMIMSSLPFFLVGLAVLHTITINLPARFVALGGFYLLTIFTAWPALPACLLGILERWLRLRRRAVAAGTKQGDE